MLSIAAQQLMKKYTHTVDIFYMGLMVAKRVNTCSSIEVTRLKKFFVRLSGFSFLRTTVCNTTFEINSLSLLTKSANTGLIVLKNLNTGQRFRIAIVMD
jgi:hypothetical protein